MSTIQEKKLSNDWFECSNVVKRRAPVPLDGYGIITTVVEKKPCNCTAVRSARLEVHARINCFDTCLGNTSRLNQVIKLHINIYINFVL